MTIHSPVVPFIRTIEFGRSGHDVVAVKRALSRNGRMEWGNFTPLWGEYAVKACKALQKAKGLKQTGKYTFSTHEALRKSHRRGSRTEWAFDKYAIQILQGEVISPRERVQMKMLDFMNYTILHEWPIHYQQLRPYGPAPHIPLLGTWYADCSEYAIRVYWWAGAPDPNRSNFNGYGNTWSLMDHGERIPLSQAGVGTLVFYNNPSHVGVCRAKVNGTWYVSEFGTESGPKNVPAQYRSITDIRRYPLI